MHWNRETIHVISFGVCGLFLLQGICSIVVVLHLPWVAAKIPLPKTANPTSCTVGFPYHLSTSPFFKEAAEIKSINNVNRGFKTHFPLNLLI